MSDHPEKRKRGRLPIGKLAMDSIQRQARFARARANEAGEVARALRKALGHPPSVRTEFLAAYADDTTQDGQLIRRGLAHALVEDPTTLAYFNRLFRQWT